MRRLSFGTRGHGGGAAPLALAFLLASASAAFGWGPDGHHIVGEIAWRFLEPTAEAEVSRLLAGDDGRALSGDCPLLEPDRTLAQASYWADRIRICPSYEWAGPYHYINVPEDRSRIDLARDCPARGCVLRGVEEYSTILGDRGASLAERREALKFLAHFVGDLHQPLHVSNAADRGGNDIPVRFFGEEANLHEVWDSLLLQHRIWWWRWLAWKLRRMADEAGESPQVPFQRERGITEEERSRWMQGTPLGWAEESLRLARSHAYAVPADGRLGRDYYERNLPLVEERLQQAGVRLAFLLNRLLGQ